MLAALPGPGQQWIGFEPSRTDDAKKVDENGNALNQNNSETKKNKKEKRDKNVVLIKSENVAGHRGDIIDDLDKLIEFIGGNDKDGTSKSKSNVNKSKLNKEERSINKKQRTRSKAKNDNMQKSTSMEEISITKLEDFNFATENESKVPLRPTKSNSDRPRERRSWGNSEPLQFQSLQLYANASAENLADFRVVTKKKKSKKRRNSISSGRRQQYANDANNRLIQSPELRRKSACSVPHSEKSNDSSDLDSVHSLPIDTNRIAMDHDSLNSNHPISYADIAKNSNSLERPKWNRPPSERKNNKGDKNLKNFINEVSNSLLTETVDKVQPNSPTDTQQTITPAIIQNPISTTSTTKTPSSTPSSTPSLTPSSTPSSIHNNTNNNNNVSDQKRPATKTNLTNDVTTYAQNWPCINKTTETKAKNQNVTKPSRNGNNNIKNVKNTQINSTATKSTKITNTKVS